jgi:hypothetical protein
VEVQAPPWQVKRTEGSSSPSQGRERWTVKWSMATWMVSGMGGGGGVVVVVVVVVVGMVVVVVEEEEREEETRPSSKKA